MSEPPGDERIHGAARLFRAMGEPGRLAVLAALLGEDHTVSELAAAVGAPVSQVSHRLRLLEADGLIRKRRDGRHTWVALADDHVRRIVADGLAHGDE